MSKYINADELVNRIVEPLMCKTCLYRVKGTLICTRLGNIKLNDYCNLYVLDESKIDCEVNNKWLNI